MQAQDPGPDHEVAKPEGEVMYDSRATSLGNVLRGQAGPPCQGQFIVIDPVQRPYRWPKERAVGIAVTFLQIYR